MLLRILSSLARRSAAASPQEQKVETVGPIRGALSPLGNLYGPDETDSLNPFEQKDQPMKPSPLLGDLLILSVLLTLGITLMLIIFGVIL